MHDNVGLPLFDKHRTQPRQRILMAE
jgi:hypothetical protein